MAGKRKAPPRAPRRAGASVKQLMVPHSWFTLVKKGKDLQIRLEAPSKEYSTFPKSAIPVLRERVSTINEAIRSGAIVVTPGVSSVEISNLPAAAAALAPGVLDPRVMRRKRDADLKVDFGGQWSPPGITIELTSDETLELLALLYGGSEAAIASILASWGLDTEVALVVASILILDTVPINICKALSPKSAVGFKIRVSLFGPTVVTPYPVE